MLHGVYDCFFMALGVGCYSQYGLSFNRTHLLRLKTYSRFQVIVTTMGNVLRPSTRSAKPLKGPGMHATCACAFVRAQVRVCYPLLDSSRRVAKHPEESFTAQFHCAAVAAARCQSCFIPSQRQVVRFSFTRS